MTVFDWRSFPANKLRWALTPAAVSGGQPVSGPPATAELSGGGWWVAEHSVARLSKLMGILAWRALMATLSKTTVTIDVPMIDLAIMQRTSSIAAKVETAAALRATSLRMTLQAGPMPKAGEYFGVTGATLGPRIHLLESVTVHDDDSFDLVFVPPLREAAAVDDPIDFNDPRCRMKVDISAIGDAWPQIEPPFRISPSIRFVETFAP